MMDGRIQTRHNRTSYEKEEVEFCIGSVTDLALSIQEKFSAE